MGDGAILFLEGFDHAGGEGGCCPDAIFAGDDVFGVMIEEADDLIVPGGFIEAFQNFGIGAGVAVVVDEDGDEFVFDGFDEEGLAQDFFSELLAAGAAGNFLEEEEHGFAGFLGLGEGGVEVAGPGDGAGFDWVWVGPGGGRREREGGQGEGDDRGAWGTHGGRSLWRGDFLQGSVFFRKGHVSFLVIGARRGAGSGSF